MSMAQFKALAVNWAKIHSSVFMMVRNHFLNYRRCFWWFVYGYGGFRACDWEDLMYRWGNARRTLVFSSHSLNFFYSVEVTPMPKLSIRKGICEHSNRLIMRFCALLWIGCMKCLFLIRLVHDCLIHFKGTLCDTYIEILSFTWCSAASRTPYFGTFRWLLLADVTTGICRGSYIEDISFKLSMVRCCHFAYFGTIAVIWCIWLVWVRLRPEGAQ